MIVCLFLSPRADISVSRGYAAVGLIGFDFRFSPFTNNCNFITPPSIWTFSQGFHAVNSITLLSSKSSSSSSSSSMNSESEGFVCTFTREMKRLREDFVKTDRFQFAERGTDACYYGVEGRKERNVLWTIYTRVGYL